MSLFVERLGLIISKNIQTGAGNNINGPCCIKVPPWCVSHFGKFYLYFADHAGSHIKLAYADKISGPWTLYEGGVLDLAAFTDAYDHVASPDICIDSAKNELRLYFHARSHKHAREQWTFAATSSDGLNFRPATDEPLAPFYLKLFLWDGKFYGMSKGGNLWCSSDGLSPFKPGGNPFNRSLSAEFWHNQPGSIRHVGLHLEEDTLVVYFSRIGDAPERIFRNRIDLKPDWEDWTACSLEEVLRPEFDYEGVNLPVTISTYGAATQPENALRDPHLLLYMNEKYLFYSVCGEQGIAVSRLYENNCMRTPSKG